MNTPSDGQVHTPLFLTQPPRALEGLSVPTNNPKASLFRLALPELLSHGHHCLTQPHNNWGRTSDRMQAQTRRLLLFPFPALYPPYFQGGSPCRSTSWSAGTGCDGDAAGTDPSTPHGAPRAGSVGCQEVFCPQTPFSGRLQKPASHLAALLKTQGLQDLPPTLSLHRLLQGAAPQKSPWPDTGTSRRRCCRTRQRLLGSRSGLMDWG